MAYIYTSPSSIKPDKTYKLNGINVKEYFIPSHNVNKLALPAKRTNKKIIGITIHNTEDLPKIEDDGRNYIASTLNNNMSQVYVHWYVDDLYAWHCFPNEYDSWSCSDGANGSGNSQTICVECIMKSETDSKSLKAKDNAARLIAQLLVENKLTTKDVYSHTYWINMAKGVTNGSKNQLCCIPPAKEKKCPIYIIPQWENFLSLVDKYYKKLTKIEEELYRVRKSWRDVTSQIGAYKNLESAKNLADFNPNYKVFNSKGKCCYTPKIYYREATTLKVTSAKVSYDATKTFMNIVANTKVIICRNIKQKGPDNKVWLKIYNRNHIFGPLDYIWIKQEDLTPIK